MTGDDQLLPSGRHLRRAFLVLLTVFLTAHRGYPLTHTVRRGENLSAIAAQYGIDADTLAGANRLGDADLLFIGQELDIPASAAPFIEYKVRKGDSLGSIATRFDASPLEISNANNLRDDDLVFVGEQLRIPNAASIRVQYTVRKGDNLASIAADLGVSAQAIAKVNGLKDANLLRVGQVLEIPGGKAPAPKPKARSSTPEKAAEPLTYTVRKGDNLESIAARHGVSVRELTRANHIRNANLVTVGQKLKIPTGSTALTAHTVRKGETLGSIAARNRLSVAEILAFNKLPRPDRIAAGQVLLLPTGVVAPPPVPSYPMIPSSTRRVLDRIAVTTGHWKHIVIHHSGTSLGSGKNIDRYHREERHMENGLAYHFVIGNGHGMKDGAIYIGGRWTRQIEGGHLAIHALNLNSIGICLIGNFEKERPSARQLNSLEALIRYLRKRTGLSTGAVTTHKLIHPKHTLCPGRRFPTEAFSDRLGK